MTAPILFGFELVDIPCQCGHDDGCPKGNIFNPKRFDSLAGSNVGSALKIIAALRAKASSEKTEK